MDDRAVLVQDAHALDSGGLRLFDTVEVAFVIRGASRDYGLVRLDHQWYSPAA